MFNFLDKHIKHLESQYDRIWQQKNAYQQEAAMLRNALREAEDEIAYLKKKLEKRSK